MFLLETHIIPLHGNPFSTRIILQKGEMSMYMFSDRIGVWYIGETSFGKTCAEAFTFGERGKR